MASASATGHSLLTPYLQTSLRLFIADQTLLKQSAQAIPKLGFVMVTAAKADANYFQAMKQLFAELRSHDALFLVNHPRRKVEDATGRQTEDYSFRDFYSGLATLVTNANKSVPEMLGRCIPVFNMAQDHDMRGRIIEELFDFGIQSVFMLSIQDYRASAADQVENLTTELQGYFQDFFLQREERTRELKEYKSAEDLRQRREEADRLMAQVEALKQAKDFDKAIALCRQAIEVLPTNPAAYLEGGRLLVKKKRYPPAMQMFRDAEQVAVSLPAPNEEIGNLRLTQVKEHLADCQSRGVAPDQAMVGSYLAEAVGSYNQAMEKARTIQLVRPQDQDAKRAEALSAIADDVLSLELDQVVGENSQVLRELGKLLKNVLEAGGKGPKELPGRHLLSLGMSALYENDFDTARDYFVKAAADPQNKELACAKLNNLGTQLRQRGHADQAIRVYQELLALKPPFMGVVLYNLAVAFQNKARLAQENNPGQAKELELEAAGLLAQAIYVDPALPAEENFYRNPVMAPLARRLLEGFEDVAQRHEPGQDPTQRACLQAVDRLEQLLRARQQREALQFLFQLTHKLKPFFLNFDQYASRPVYLFAQSLQGALANHPDPKMQTFGKVLGVLVARGQRALTEDGSTGHPVLDKVMEPLMVGDQAGAAKAMSLALMVNPEVLRGPALAANKSLLNLAREINRKLAGVDLKAFLGH